MPRIEREDPTWPQQKQLRTALSTLAALAFDGSEKGPLRWSKRGDGRYHKDPVSHYIDGWQQAAMKHVEHLFNTADDSGFLQPVHEELYFWLSRKRETLASALEQGQIVQVDVTDQVLQVDVYVVLERIYRMQHHIKEGLPSPDANNAALQLRKTQHDAAAHRYKDIVTALGVEAGPELSKPARDTPVRQRIRSLISDVKTIGSRQFASHYVYIEWAEDFEALYGRLDPYWTGVEYESLAQLLDEMVAVCRARREHASQVLSEWPPLKIILRSLLHGHLGPAENGLNHDRSLAHWQPAWLDEFWYHRRELPFFNPHEPVARSQFM